MFPDQLFFRLVALAVERRLLMPRLAELKKCDPCEGNATPDYSQVTREKLESDLTDLKWFVPESFREDKLGGGFAFGLVESTNDSFEDRVKGCH